MKKFIFLSLLLFAACMEEPEVKTTRNGLQDHPVYPSDPLALVPCESDYKWWHQNNTFPGYSNYQTAQGVWNGYHWDMVLKPQWDLGGNVMYYSSSLDNVVWKLRVVNDGGQTFRYRVDGGAWVTLTSGQNGLMFTRTIFGQSPCQNNGQGHLAPLPIEVDVERLSCGSSPYTMRASLRIISISSGHNYSRPGDTINEPIFLSVFEGAQCSL